ncbi:hypothetical protein CRE_19481 [Caenorhabditis remanei]|uniref:RING-type domain-containing protein n=1 Tax=Caenorhabditis remanei TaxID=31234 RepID=E3NG58_CAERE|nr:hypothetical protein CRE_19481 [Caenorhabditis remanei]
MGEIEIPDENAHIFITNKHFICFLQVLNLIYTYNVIKSNFDDRGFILKSVGAIILVLTVLGALKSILILMDKTSGMEKLQKCSRDLLIGFGGIALCGVIPQLCVWWLRESMNMQILHVVCNLTPILFHLLFIRQHYTIYRVKSHNKNSEDFGFSKVRFAIVLIHLFSLVLFCSFAKKVVGEKDSSAVVGILIKNTLVFAPASAELFAILLEGIYFKTEVKKPAGVKKNTPSLRPSNPRPRPSSQPIPYYSKWGVYQAAPIQQDLHLTGSTCQICSSGFSATVIPRILVGCGHTVCQACIQKLPREGFQCVLCPFCRKLTKLPDGLPSKLPKNYAVLDMIQEIGISETRQITADDIRRAAYYLIPVTIFLGILKLLLLCVDKRQDTENLIKCKRDLLIGYGGIAVCGVVPQILVWIYRKSLTLYLTQVICTLSPIVLFFLFLIPHFSTYHVKNQSPEACSHTRLLVVSIHFAYLIGASIIADQFAREEGQKYNYIVGISLMYTLACGFTTAEFFAIWKDGIIEEG